MISKVNYKEKNEKFIIKEIINKIFYLMIFIFMNNCTNNFLDKKDDSNSKLNTTIGIFTILDLNSTTCVDLPEKIDKLSCTASNLIYSCTDGTSIVKYTFTSIEKVKKSIYIPFLFMALPDVLIGNFASKIELSFPSQQSNSSSVINFSYTNEFDAVTNYVLNSNISNGYKLTYSNYDKNGFPLNSSINLNPIFNQINNYTVSWTYQSESSTKPNKYVMYNLNTILASFDLNSNGFTTKGVVGNSTISPTYSGTITLCSKK